MNRQQISPVQDGFVHVLPTPDQAAAGIGGVAIPVGRLGSAATTVKLLSREIARAADALADDAS